MKKEIIISSEQFKDAIQTLWEMGEAKGVSFTLAPVHKMIYVHQGPGEPIASIHVVDVVDEYDLEDAIFKAE